MLDARSIYEVELQSLTEKPWRQSGSDLSDWFNYGFDEISWEAYCLRKTELAELCAALKQNVIAYTGMPENQLLALPPEMRTMAINSANAMPLGVPQNMIGGIPSGDLMDMGGMGMAGIQSMQPNMLGTGMNGDQTMHMRESIVGNMQGAVPGIEGGFLHPAVSGGMTENSGANGNAYPAAYSVDVSVPHGEQAFSARVPARNPAQVGHGTPPPLSALTQAVSITVQAVPTRPASALPPKVPTGPRNRTTYKDKDREPVKQEVEGLDYGGGAVVDSTTSGRKRPYAGGDDNSRSKRR
ncbi:hypothetical protein CALVIDRAFT_532121 [Calocera viscosa TUFC12733]|uniref:Pre-mRNA polyadenylation factor Fip1 domain-containing protein n=1 Tax=Calocera viscosa (strain TUFC12733) TaxID=1330018 RepID=A0A167FDT5_CALVF|nr:hypothetical protein CALVIDRAFT_532121 [Calocera viscosa TUFC12733]